MGMFIIIFILIGVFVGRYYHNSIDTLLEGMLEKNIYHCPPPSIVEAHRLDTDVFETEKSCGESKACKAEKIYWQMNTHLWEVSSKISFMQAIIGEDHNLVCYYRWPKSDSKKVNGWLTIKLSPKATQMPKPYGAFWTKKSEDRLLCNAGLHACGFYMGSNSDGNVIVREMKDS